MAGVIGESARGRLQRSPYFALRDIGCVFRDGILTLRGRLPTYFLKQMAQTAVADVEGVTSVVNQIEVTASKDRAPMGRDSRLR